MASQNRHHARKALLLGFLVLVGAVLFARSRFAWDTACSVARRQLPLLLGAPVGIDECEVDPLGQALVLRGVSLFSPSGESTLFAAEEIEVRLGWMRPFARTLALDLVRVERPRLTLDLSQPAPDSAGADGMCPLTPLQHLQIDTLELRDAEVGVALPEGARVEIGGLDVEWRLRRGTAEFEVEARRGLVRLGPGRELAVSRLSLSGGLLADEEELELTRAELSLDDITTRVTGRIRQLCNPELALDAQVLLPLRTATRAAGSKQPAGGRIWARLGIRGPATSPLADVELSASDLTYGPYTPGDFTAQLHVSRERLLLESLKAASGEGRATLKGSLGFSSSLPVQLQVDTERASFGDILERAGLEGPWVDFPASARGSLAGYLLPRPHLTGKVELRAGRFNLTTYAYDAPSRMGTTLLSFAQGRARSRVEILADRASLTELEVESGRSKLQGGATLFFDPARGLAVQGRADLELADFGAIAELPWSGRGAGTFSVEGPYADVKVDASLNLRDFVFWKFGLGVVQGKVAYRNKVLKLPALTGQKGHTQYFGNAALTFGPKLHARAHLEIPRGRTEDVVDLISGLHPSIAVFQGPLAGKTSGTVDIEGPVSRFGGTVELAFEDTTYYGRRFGDGQARLHFIDGAAMVLDRTVLEGPLGRTWVDGRFTFEGSGLDYRFGADALSLAELVGPERAKELGISGRLVLVGEVEGNGEEPVVVAKLTSPRILFADRDVGAAHLEGRLVGKDLQLWGHPFQDANGSLRMRVEKDFPFDASVTLSLPEIRPLLPPGAIAQRLSGSLTGVLQAKGTLADLEETRVSATVEKLRLARGDFSGWNDGPIQLSYAGGRLDVQSFVFRGPNTELTASGWAGPSAVDLTMRGTLDVRLLESFVPGLERTGGKVELSGVMTGSLKNPSIVGSADITDAKLSFREHPYNLRGLSGRLEFSEQRVLLEDLHGNLNDGRIRARGDVRLARFEPEELEVSLQLDEVSLRPTEDLPLTATGELLLSGKPEALLLAGDLDILRLRYQKGLELESFLRDLGQRSVLSVGAGEKREEFLTFDVRLHLGDVRVDNNLARAKLLGNLRFTGTNLRPGLLGTLEAAEGSQAFFRNNQFAVSHGLIEFNDRHAIDPVFDFHAQTQNREYLVKLHAFGRVKDPQVVLSSEPDLSEGDILSLLTLGVTSGDKESDTATAGAGLAAEAFFNFSGLDRQVQRFLPSNPLLRDMSFQISTTYNDANGQVEATAQLQSKFLTEQLKLGLTQPVSGRGTRAQAEYRFDNRLSAQAQWDNENSNASFGNLGLELKLSWEVE